MQLPGLFHKRFQKPCCPLFFNQSADLSRRSRTTVPAPEDHLSQHADPSSGCAQQAPPFSSADWLGAQHTEALFFEVQHDATTGSALAEAVILLF